MCVLLTTQLLWLVGRLGIRKQVLQHQLVVCRYSDLPYLVHNRCVIDVYGDVFVLSCLLLDSSVGVGAFVIELSQISSFSS